MLANKTPKPFRKFDTFPTRKLTVMTHDGNSVLPARLATTIGYIDIHIILHALAYLTYDKVTTRMIAWRGSGLSGWLIFGKLQT